MDWMRCDGEADGNFMYQDRGSEIGTLIKIAYVSPHLV
jgi:hypothetical protein